MRVVVDLQSCQAAGKNRGIGRYSLELLKAMAELDNSIQYTVVLNALFPESVRKLRAELVDFISPGQIRTFEIPSKVSYASNNRRLTKAAECVREKFICDLEPDVIHLTSLFEGLDEDIATSTQRIFSRIPVACTLYDLIPLSYEELYLNSNIAKLHYMDKIKFIQDTDLLLCISDYVKRDFQQHFPLYSGELHTVGGGVSTLFSPDVPEEPEFSALCEAYHIKRFLLYTAGFDLRKNHRRLIKAFSTLPSFLRDEYKLVLVGEGAAEIFAELGNLALACGLKPGQIIFPGRVSDNVLVKLYSTCSLFVFPSLAEGLGLPVLEAMACGAPVIASETTCLPEIIGDQSLLFDPNSVASIALKIREALDSKDRLSEMAISGRTRAASFTWREAASKSVRALKLAAASKAATGDKTATLEKVNLDWGLQGEFTPLERARIASCIASNEVETDANWTREASLNIGWMSYWRQETCEESLTPTCTIAFPGQAPQLEGRYEISRWDAGNNDQLRRLEEYANEKIIDAIVLQLDNELLYLLELEKFICRRFRADTPIYIVVDSLTTTPFEPASKLLELAPIAMMADQMFVPTQADADLLDGYGIRGNVATWGIGSIEATLLELEGRTLADRNAGEPAAPGAKAALPQPSVAYLLRMIRRRLSRPWIDHLRPPLETLPMPSGMLSHGAVVTTGRGGHLVHGPYAELSAGRYKLTMQGRSFDFCRGSALVQITDDQGLSNILEEQLSLNCENIYFSCCFLLTSDATSLEVSVICDVEARFEIQTYKISSQFPD